jgi:2-aminoadipate transaminase
MTLHPPLADRSAQSGSSRIRALLRVTERPGMLSLAGGLPASESLPVAAVAAAAAAALGEVGPTGATALQYGPTEGLAALRQLVAVRAGVGAGSVLVTTGSQQAIDLVARVMVDPGDTVIVESPAYLGAVQSFRASGAALVAVGSDACGMRVDEVEQILSRGARPSVVYVAPDFHNPTGASMSLDRRRHLAALADHYGFLVAEDSPYGELAYDGVTTAPIASFGENVVRIESSSKTLAPGLRVGWMYGPEWLVEACVRAKQSADLHTSTLDQMIVARLVSDTSWYDGHLVELRLRYAARARSFGGALTAAFGDRLSFAESRGGLFTWATFTDGTDTEVLAERALEHGVAFVPGDAFAVAGEPHHSAMRLCHATLDEPSLHHAVDRLFAAWEGKASVS